MAIDIQDMKASRITATQQHTRLLIWFIALVLILSTRLLVEAEAEQSAKLTFTVANSPPSVGTVECGYIPLQESADYLVWCSAPITDLNGFQDINGCNGTLITKSQKTEKPRDEVQHSNGTCILSDDSNTTATCSCSFGLFSITKKTTTLIGVITGKDSEASSNASSEIIIPPVTPSTTRDTSPTQKNDVKPSTGQEINNSWFSTLLYRIKILTL
jgi:hypothetical protein